MRSRKRFNKYLRRLRQHYPTPIPTQIRFVTSDFLRKHYPEHWPNHAGLSYGNERAVIHLDATASCVVALDALVHEWAHIHDDPYGERLDRHEHVNSWGECYARAYRAMDKPVPGGVNG